VAERAARPRRTRARRAVAAGRALAVITTVGQLAQARRIARALVQRRLAACVHICPVESLYRWRARLCHEREYRLTCKTSIGRRAALMAALEQLHPYELPALYAVALERVSAAYAAWIEQECRDPAMTRPDR